MVAVDTFLTTHWQLGVLLASVFGVGWRVSHLITKFNITLENHVKQDERNMKEIGRRLINIEGKI